MHEAKEKKKKNNSFIFFPQRFPFLVFLDSVFLLFPLDQDKHCTESDLSLLTAV